MAREQNLPRLEAGGERLAREATHANQGGHRRELQSGSVAPNLVSINRQGKR
jgi:hypothetical protein